MDDTKYYIDIVENGLNSIIITGHTRFIIPLIAHFIHEYIVFGSFHHGLTSLFILNSLFVTLTALSMVYICNFLKIKSFNCKFIFILLISQLLTLT